MLPSLLPSNLCWKTGIFKLFSYTQICFTRELYNVWCSFHIPSSSHQISSAMKTRDKVIPNLSHTHLRVLDFAESPPPSSFTLLWLKQIKQTKQTNSFCFPIWGKGGLRWGCSSGGGRTGPFLQEGNESSRVFTEFIFPWQGCKESTLNQDPASQFLPTTRKCTEKKYYYYCSTRKPNRNA